MLPFPSVEGVRLATLKDLRRISIVAAASFFWSPTFRFQRPRYRDFPEDTIASYRSEYAAAIQDPACVVLVAEDMIKEDEAACIYEALRYAYAAEPVGSRGIVGVCSISLIPGSCYVGRFQSDYGRAGTTKFGTQTSILPQGAEGLRRDQSSVTMNLYNAATQPAKVRHLSGTMRLSTLAVAPAYWRKGHASRLVNFCTQLADLEEALLVSPIISKAIYCH